MAHAVLPSMVKIKSSNIEAIGHDGGTREFHVKFRGGGHYVYADVHRNFYEAMLTAKSPGAWHAAHVKDVFRHRKL